MCVYLAMVHPICHYRRVFMGFRLLSDLDSVGDGDFTHVNVATCHHPRVLEPTPDCHRVMIQQRREYDYHRLLL